LSIGVGGLFDYWAGNLRRAPVALRRAGLEWATILAQQPHKWRRYFVEGPALLALAVQPASGLGNDCRCIRTEAG